MRRTGTVRFQPFYTLQWFDDVSMCWRDVKGKMRYPTEDAAWAASPADGRSRVAVVSPGRCEIIERIAEQQPS